MLYRVGNKVKVIAHTYFKHHILPTAKEKWSEPIAFLHVSLLHLFISLASLIALGFTKYHIQSSLGICELPISISTFTFFLLQKPNASPNWTAYLLAPSQMNFQQVKVVQNLLHLARVHWCFHNSKSAVYFLLNLAGNA